MAQRDEKTGLKDWLAMVDRLRYAPQWAAEGPVPVEMTQTHISVVLLGRERVLKLKKPVNFGFLDYTTLEQRRLACEAEIRLNRRLCEQTYLKVQPIGQVDGSPQLSESGVAIEYGVLMKRLPAERMLDEMVRQDSVTEADIERVARRLDEFHRTARRGPDVDRWGTWEQVRGNWDENFAQIHPFVGRTIDASAYRLLREWVEGWLTGHRAVFEERIAAGKVVDGHGDVRCESVCVTDGICIFDCIEFNDRFRCCDVASEVAFLAMDLDSLGRPDLGYHFTERYQAQANDAHLVRLLPFYRCYRAYVRGKVLSFRLDEPEFSAADKRRAAERAAGYFELARRYATPLPRPTVVVVMGLAGTGKTSMARAIAGELGLRVVSTDAVRQELFGHEKGTAAYGQGAYRSEANQRTYEALVERGRGRLIEDGGAVLDGTFLREDDRLRVHEMALTTGATERWIECELPAELVRRRLERRRQRHEGLSDATWETYLRQREDYTASPGRGEDGHLVVDMTQSLSECARRASDWLREHGPPSTRARMRTLRRL
jgi:aminoglycoside phosphotransferase family enzyme/predicted kinase